MDIDLSDLRAISVLAETLHFGRAAERLHVSQPALSKRIHRMEDRIGGRLLVRGYRDVRLTEAGRLLASRGRQVLSDSAEIVALSERAARGEAGALRIGFGIASILGFLPKVLLRFRRAYPDVLLQLRDMPTPDQVNALVNQSIDIGFVRRPVRDDRLVMRPVLNERLAAALGPRSPWDRQARPGLGRRRAVHSHLARALRQLLRPRAERLRRRRLRASNRAGDRRALHRNLARARRPRRVARPPLRGADATTRRPLPRAHVARRRLEHRDRLAPRLRRRAAGAAIRRDGDGG